MEYNFKDTVFGIHPVEEAIESGKQIDKILLRKGGDQSHYKQIKKLAAQNLIQIQEVPIEKLNKLSRGNHQGVVAFISPVEFQSVINVVPQLYEEGVDPFFLILDRVTDVKNFGAITRTAECAGINAIVVPTKGLARIGNEALKGSAGALLHINICKEHNLKQAIKYLKMSGLKIIACSEKTDKLVYHTDLKGPIALLFGSEEDGISDQLLKLADERVKLPLFGKISSLNVGAAVSAICYEAVRQRI